MRSRRGLAILRALWEARDRVARQTDVAPGRLLPDSSLAAAGQGLPRDVGALLALKDFHGRGASRHRRHWAEALTDAWAIPEAELPSAARRSDDPPPASAWGQRDPVAAARLERARAALGRRAQELALPVENLLTPELVRRLMWAPPSGAPASDQAEITALLLANGARPWQVEQTAALLASALRAG